jgi:hypothetical protein
MRREFCPTLPGARGAGPIGRGVGFGLGGDEPAEGFLVGLVGR